jgi:O-antigen/teichoic acid export membrane protein
MGVLAWWCFHELVRGPRARLHKGEAPLLLKYGGWVTVTSIIGPWLLMMDRFAIGATLGAVAVAIYTVPLQLAKQVAVFPGALTGALFPSLSAASVETRQRYAVNAVYALSAMVSLPVLAGIFLIDPVMHLWIGRSIAKAGTPVGRILLIGFWSNAFALIPYTVLQSRGRPDLVTKTTLSEIPFYFLILWLGLKTWGVEGVGVAVAVRLTADYLLLSWVAERAFPAWPTLLGNLALLLIGLWLASLFGFHDWRWWACGSALGLAMVGLNWATLPSELRRRVIDWLSRYGGGRVFRPVAAGADK